VKNMVSSLESTQESRRWKMKKFLGIAVSVWALPCVALAAGGGDAPSELFFTVTVATAGFGLAVSTLCASIAQGILGGRAMEAIARQPEAAPRIQTAMLLGLAFIESLVIYVLLIAFILLFANPFIKIFAG